jgi:RecJ-like exonuclease
MADEDCPVCFGDGYIQNSFGITNKCPSCHGSGRRADLGARFRDVTKTKDSHFHKPGAAAEEKKKRDAPVSPAGMQLAAEIQTTARFTTARKEGLIREIVEYESSHGSCTKTFVSKMRKKLRTVDGD